MNIAELTLISLFSLQSVLTLQLLQHLTPSSVLKYLI